MAATLVEPTDGVASGPEKRAALERIGTLGLRQELHTEIVFVLEADEQEVEMGRDNVVEDDVPTLAAAYWQLNTWAQRTCMIHLLTDQDDSCLRPVWLDILTAPSRAEQDGRHAAKAIAIVGLDEGADDFSAYFDDLERTERRAAELQRAHET